MYLVSFFFWLLAMLSNLFAPPSALQLAPSTPSPIVPPMLGTWQASQAFLVDSSGHLRVDRASVNPKLSDNSLMPYGQQIELTGGYDKEADVAYWQIKWLPPFPPNACQFPFLQFHCTEIEGSNRPDQVPIRLEYRMQVSHDDIASFFPVGATKTDRMYYLRCGSNDEWVPELYVSKDRQRMWVVFTPDDFEHYSGLQEYHRVAEYKHR